jgi:hypothetical protein
MIMKLTTEQTESYLETLKYVLGKYPYEKLNRIFEMSIDMCDQVCWDNEDEVGLLFDEFFDIKA